MNDEERVSELVERRAKALRDKYMGFGHCITSWKDTSFKDYWRSLAISVLDDPDLVLMKAPPDKNGNTRGCFKHSKAELHAFDTGYFTAQQAVIPLAKAVRKLNRSNEANV